MNAIREIKEKAMNFEQYFGITDIGKETIERHLYTIRSEWDRHVLDIIGNNIQLPRISSDHLQSARRRA